MKSFFVILLCGLQVICWAQYESSLYEITIEPDALSIYNAPFYIDTVIDQRGHTYLGQNKHSGYSFYLKPSFDRAVQDFYKALLPEKEGVAGHQMIVDELAIEIVEDWDKRVYILHSNFSVRLDNEVYECNETVRQGISAKKEVAVKNFTILLLHKMMQKILRAKTQTIE